MPQPENLSSESVAADSAPADDIAPVKKERQKKSMIGAPVTAGMQEVLDAINEIDEEGEDITFAAIAGKMGIEGNMALMKVGLGAHGLKERGLITVEGTGAAAVVKLAPEPEEEEESEE